MIWLFNIYKEYKIKKTDKERRNKIINSEYYLIRLRRSYRTIIGTKYSTIDETLSIEEIKSLILNELDRLTDIK